MNKYSYGYREEIRSRQGSFRRIQRLNTHISFIMELQLSCLATLETQFQIVIDKLVLYQKTNCYKGKELLIEDDEDASPIRFVKA